LHRHLLVLADALGALPLAAADVSAPATARLDHVHTGGRGVEIFALDRVVRGPLPWPGHLARTNDDGNTGAYPFEVRDASGTVVYARGFASIYGEWVTTAEAADSYRSFHESLRFPEPPAPVEIVVQRRQPDQSFADVWRTNIDPRDPFVDLAPPPRQALIAVEQHGAPADKVDVLLLSEWADYLFVHEFGHHFAALADEYYTSPVAYEPVAKVVEPWEPT